MKPTAPAPVAQRFPPWHVILVLGLAAVVGLVLTAVYSLLALLLLPALPAFLGAIVGIWGAAIEYARGFVKGADDW